MHNRSLTSYVQDLSKGTHGRILVLTGARQTGKTTLIRQVFPDYEYLSIEDPVAREQYARLSAAQWKKLYPRAKTRLTMTEEQIEAALKAHRNSG
jgi:predicted kinase